MVEYGKRRSRAGNDDQATIVLLQRNQQRDFAESRRSLGYLGTYELIVGFAYNQKRCSKEGKVPTRSKAIDQARYPTQKDKLLKSLTRRTVQTDRKPDKGVLLMIKELALVAIRKFSIEPVLLEKDDDRSGFLRSIMDSGEIVYSR